MQFEYSPYILPLIAAALVSGWVCLYAWSRRNTAGAIALSGLSLMITLWLLGYTLEIAGANLATKLFFGKSQYIGIALAPLMWFIFSYNHANPTHTMSHRAMVLFMVIPLISILIAFTTDSTRWLWTEFGIQQNDGFSVLSVSHGFWFWIHSGYCYLLLLAGTIIMLRSILRNRGVYRGQAVAMIIAVLAPWIGNIVYLSGISPIPDLDITPFTFVITTVAIAGGIFGFRLVDLTPLAREAVIDGMQDAVIVLNHQNEVADLNKAAQTLAGRSGAQAIGKPVSAVFSRFEPLLKNYQEVFTAEEEINIGSDQEPIWYELLITPLYDHQKHLIGRVVMMRDITRRKKADERIAQLSRAVEASPTSIVITDHQGNIQYVNPKFSQITGYSFEEALGKNPRILKTDHTPAEVHSQLWKTILAGKEWRGEFCNRQKNGEIYWEMASISPITDAHGKITHFVSVKEDITDRKASERVLAIAHEQALEASRLKSQLLAKVSHELRTPLGGVLGYAELLYNGTFGALTESQKNATAQIVESSRYLEIMVNELLDQAQIESKTLVLHPRRFSPAAILRQVEASMSVLCHNKGLALETHLSPDLPQELIGDDHRLQEILLNLAGNAVKFTKAGSVRIQVFQADSNHWAMQVSDTGAGIPTEAHSAIFEPFRQVDNAITHENRGTGLGLSITKQLVELMGGTITLSSEVGQGSTFTVLLPFEKLPEKNE